MKSFELTRVGSWTPWCLVTTRRMRDDITQHPSKRVYVYDLYIEGAGWGPLQLQAHWLLTNPKSWDLDVCWENQRSCYSGAHSTGRLLEGFYSLWKSVNLACLTKILKSLSPSRFTSHAITTDVTFKCQTDKTCWKIRFQWSMEITKDQIKKNLLFGCRTTTCWETVGPGIHVVVTATHAICVNATDQVRGLFLQTVVQQTVNSEETRRQGISVTGILKHLKQNEIYLQICFNHFSWKSCIFFFFPCIFSIIFQVLSLNCGPPKYIYAAL